MERQIYDIFTFRCSIFKYFELWYRTPLSFTYPESHLRDNLIRYSAKLCHLQLR